MPQRLRTDRCARQELKAGAGLSIHQFRGGANPSFDSPVRISLKGGSTHPRHDAGTKI